MRMRRRSIRRVLSSALAAAMLLGVMTTTAFAENTCDDGCFVVNGITYLPISETTNEVEVVNPGHHPVNGATVSTYTGEISIPATVEHSGTTYYVTKIGLGAFSRTPSDPQVTSVTIAEGVKEIGETAFQGCSGLTALSLPSTITTIGPGAFGQCTGLKCLEIPAGVTNGLVQALTCGSIGGYQTFYPYNFPYDETSGEGIKFAQGSSYEFVTETDGTNTANLLYNGTILDGVLRTYTASNNEITGDELTSLTIREGTTEIGPSAMAAMKNLETVTMPAGGTLKTIGYGAFADCAALASIDLSSVEMIGVMAFSGTALTSANLSSLKTFETITEEDYEFSMAFFGCESLTTVLFGDVEKVPADAFSGYEDEAALTFVMLGTTPPEFGEDFYLENLTVIIPAGSEEAYKDSALGEYIQSEDSETKPGITYSLALAATAEVKVGETVTLDTTGTVVPTGASLVWESDSAAVATVAEGVVTGVSAGTANITASIVLGGVELVSKTCAVTVKAADVPFVPVPPVAPTQPTKPTEPDQPDTPVIPGALPFVDVSANDWYYEDVAYVYAQGIMTGSTASTFAPNDAMTRAMVWTVLGRMSGENVEGGSPWYALAQAWAVSDGVSDGTEPNSSITREQLVTMLYRQAGSPEVGVSELALLGRFTDGESVSSWAEEAMAWAVSQGILTGDGDLLNPQATATRAQVAAILARFCAGSEN